MDSSGVTVVIGANELYISTCADIINQKVGFSIFFNSLFISVLNAPVPPLSIKFVSKFYM